MKTIPVAQGTRMICLLDAQKDRIVVLDPESKEELTQLEVYKGKVDEMTLVELGQFLFNTYGLEHLEDVHKERELLGLKENL